jgi:hypothetical protein
MNAWQQDKTGRLTTVRNINRLDFEFKLVCELSVNNLDYSLDLVSAFGWCVKLIAWQFGNPNKGERPPLEHDTKQQLAKNITDWEDLVYPILICEV